MDFIPLLKVNLTDDDIAKVVNVLQSGMLVQGKEVLALEKKISNYLGVKHTIAASNGTATLHLALLALGIKPGDEVILPALSYIATANVLEIVGAKPVFVDIDLATFNIDVAQIEDKITSKTKAILPVHEFGLMSDMSAILKIAKHHQLHVIEDAACALGANFSNKNSGSFGDIGSFSLHPRKAITSGEGGFLTTNDDELAERLRILRNHGAGTINGKPEFVEAGLNYRLTDFQAALVNNQMDRLEDSLEVKSKLANHYFKKLNGHPKLLLPSTPENYRHSWQTYHVVFKDETINRDDVILALKDKGIGTNYGAQCLPFQYFYQKKYGLDCKKIFPNALQAYQAGLALPMYDTLKLEEVDYVVECLIEILDR